MPIIDGEEVLEVTANQLDEIIFNSNYGAITYRSLQPTTTPLFSSQTVSASTAAQSTGVYTGNNAKMSVTFSNTGTSTNCTMNLYGSDHEDLSLAGVIATCTLGAGEDPVRFAIDPIAIPAYTFAEIINGDSVNSAIGTIEITTWQEPEEV
ncbi:MAG: hypothetical protein WCR86_11055 [Parabacteroides sp.]